MDRDGDGPRRGDEDRKRCSPLHAFRNVMAVCQYHRSPVVDLPSAISTDQDAAEHCDNGTGGWRKAGPVSVLL